MTAEQLRDIWRRSQDALQVAKETERRASLFVVQAAIEEDECRREYEVARLVQENSGE